jgi:hypothetical protein
VVPFVIFLSYEITRPVEEKGEAGGGGVDAGSWQIQIVGAHISRDRSKTEKKAIRAGKEEKTKRRKVERYT